MPTLTGMDAKVSHSCRAYSDEMAAADTIRILVATDSHVGFEERDPIRKDDSWKSFHEVMCLAKSQDVRIFDLLIVNCLTYCR